MTEWVPIGISIGAVIVALCAWWENRRSANAAEKSASIALASAVSNVRAVEIMALKESIALLVVEIADDQAKWERLDEQQRLGQKMTDVELLFLHFLKDGLTKKKEQLTEKQKRLHEFAEN